jgi:hypothetical protein
MFQWGDIHADRQHAEAGPVQVRGHSELETNRILCPVHGDFGVSVPCTKGRLPGFDRT